MPYSFRDTDSAVDNYVLPSEALQINGDYIEELFAQDLTLSATYETTRVQGRELSAQEAQEIEVGVRHGSFLASRRFKPRKIVVQYKLEASSNEHFRKAFNKLNGILNVEDAQLIFADEPDKYFIGTVTEVDEVEPGRNAVFGEFSITCFDPFKYSVEEYTVEPTNGTFLLNYDGTMPAYPKFEADFSSDCGYVAFLDDSNKVIQIGNPEQKDGVDYPRSQTLVNHNFSTGLTGWTTNAGTTYYGPQWAKQVGSFKIANKRAEIGNLGTGELWHGPSLYRALPADQSGETGAADWRFSCKILFEKNHGNNDGHFEASLLNSGKEIVAAFYMDNEWASNIANVELYVAPSTVRKLRISVAKKNKFFGTNGGQLTIQKTNKSTTPGANIEVVTFKFGNLSYSFRTTSLGKVYGISFYMGLYGAVYGVNDGMCSHGIYNAQFIKDNCTRWKDVPNLFSSGDTLFADTSEALIKLNNLESPELGALGNQWESFALQPGLNQIGVAWSRWATQPTFRMKYRKVYI